MIRAFLVISLLIACGDSGPTPEDKLRATLIAFNGHVVVMKGTDFGDYRNLAATIRREPGVTSVAPFVFFEALLTLGGGETRPIAIKGIAPEATPLSPQLTPPDVLAGYRPPGLAQPAPPDVDPAPDDFPDVTDDELADPFPIAAARTPPRAAPALAGPVHVVMGLDLARDLGVKVGDVVRVVIPAPLDPDSWEPADPIARDVRVVGTMKTHEDYDARTLLTTFEAAQALQGVGDQALGLEVRIDDERAAARVARAITKRLGHPFRAVDWCELNQSVLRCKL